MNSNWALTMAFKVPKYLNTQDTILDNEMVKSIEKLEEAQLHLRKQYQTLKLELMELETKLISTTLNKNRAVESLTKHRECSLKSEEPEKQIDLERFRKAFSEIIKHLK